MKRSTLACIKRIFACILADLEAVGRRQWQPTLVLLPGISHGQRCLVGYSPWGRKELDTTERLHFHFSLSCTGEGNGNPLQYSCLENPRDGGAWCAAIYGVAQSQTRLTWLSSSSSRGCRNRSNAFTPEVRLKLSSHIPWHSLAHLPWVHEDVQRPIWRDGKCN